MILNTAGAFLLFFKLGKMLSLTEENISQNWALYFKKAKVFYIL